MPSGDELTPERILEEISRIAFGEGNEEVRPGDRLRALQTLARLTGMGSHTDEEDSTIVDDL